jgi:hypothetical protein
MLLSTSDSAVATAPYSFAMALYPTGSVEMRYDSVSDPALYGGWTATGTASPRPWLIGMRSQGWVYPTAVFAADYNTTRAGVYVPRPAISSNTTAVFCTFGSTSITRPAHEHGREQPSDGLIECVIAIRSVG